MLVILTWIAWMVAVGAGIDAALVRRRARMRELTDALGITTAKDERDEARAQAITLQSSATLEREKVAIAVRRAEFAEGIVKGQAKHIETLEGSNQTMLTAITDMRRVGFSLSSDLLNEPASEEITSVHDDDLKALEEYPHLAMDDADL